MRAISSAFPKPTNHAGSSAHCHRRTDLQLRWLGITCPWDYRSLLSVVAFGLLELTFWAILWPSFDGSTAAVVLGLHVILAAVTVMLWLVMITWDPRKALMISDTDPRSQVT